MTVQAYESAIELDSGRLYSLLRAGGIQLALTSTGNAADHFRAALKLHPDHPAALLGMAKTLLTAARVAASIHAPGGAHPVCGRITSVPPRMTTLTPASNPSCTLF